MINIIFKFTLINNIRQVRVFGVSYPVCEAGVSRWVPRDLLGHWGSECSGTVIILSSIISALEHPGG